MNKVYLVGAGPGDEALITWKGRQLLERADVILYDNLASPALLKLAPKGAQTIYVGKKKAVHSYSQQEICQMLIDHAREGKTVVRLKGGDPFIFGRGGEEAEALAGAGVLFEIVPGVTTPLGIAAYTGVPLTHREHTSVVTFVTGHDVSSIDWAKAGHAETLVVFMGLTHARSICDAILAQGRDPQTPAMAVRWATRPCQQTIAGTLQTLPGLIEDAAMRPPATLVIGPVVELRRSLDWFERLPLFGRRIVSTRAWEQSDALTSRLRELGAEAIDLPAIEICPAADPSALDNAIAVLEQYDWVVFTSANGVRFFVEHLDRSQRDWRALRAKIAAIGPATQAAVEQLHLKVDLTAVEAVAESLLEEMAKTALQGQRILLARAAVAREVLPAGLRSRGAVVDVVEAYRTNVPKQLAGAAKDLFSAGTKPDWVTFTSSSTVQNFVEATGVDMLSGVKVASIGPITSATARRLGVAVTVEASRYDVDGLVDAILSAETGSV